MLIFNTTLHLDDSVHDECLEYIKKTYIPRSLEHNLLEQPSLSRIESRYEESGLSYALQFKAKDMDMLNKWAEVIGDTLQEELTARYGNKVTGFVTLLEEIPL